MIKISNANSSRQFIINFRVTRGDSIVRPALSTAVRRMDLMLCLARLSQIVIHNKWASPLIARQDLLSCPGGLMMNNVRAQHLNVYSNSGEEQTLDPQVRVLQRNGFKLKLSAKEEEDLMRT